MRPELERRLAVRVEALERAILDGVHAPDDAPGRVRVDLCVVPIFVDERPLIGLAGLIDWRGSGRLSAVVRSAFFRGALGEQLLTPGERRWPGDRLVLVGVGARADFDEDRAREFGRRCVEIARGLAATSVLIALPSGAIERGLIEVAFDSLLEAIERSAVEEPHEPPPAQRTGTDDQPPGADLLSESDGAADPSEDPPGAASPEAAAALESQRLESPANTPARPASRWWVVVDEAVVARLRRVRSGPPRAARGGPSLHT